jgi:hypothetical protein
LTLVITQVAMISPQGWRGDAGTFQPVEALPKNVAQRERLTFLNRGVGARAGELARHQDSVRLVKDELFVVATCADRVGKLELIDEQRFSRSGIALAPGRK